MWDPWVKGTFINQRPLGSNFTSFLGRCDHRQATTFLGPVSSSTTSEQSKSMGEQAVAQGRLRPCPETSSRLGPEVTRVGQPRLGPSHAPVPPRMKINLQMHILREPQASSVISHHPWGAVLKPCLSVSLGAGRTLQGWPPGHSELQAPLARQRLGSRLPRVKWWVLDPLLPTACRTLTCTPGGVRVFGSLGGLGSPPPHRRPP